MQKINKKFQKEWIELKNQKRIEIHIHGFEFTVYFYNKFREKSEKPPKI